MDQEMNVVAHETERMYAMAIALSSFLHEEIDAVAVFVKENVLAGIATQDHVVKGARIMNSCFSCHCWIRTYKSNKQSSPYA